MSGAPSTSSPEAPSETLYVPERRMENAVMESNHPVRRSPDYRPSSRLRLNGGRLVAYIQPQPGEEVTVTASATYLQPATLRIRTEE